MNKTSALLMTLALVFALMSPLKKEWRGVLNDSFPLSWYPMFSKPRPPLEKITYMVGVLSDDTRRVIKSTYFVRGPMNQARMHVKRYGRNKKKSKELCKKAAERMAVRTRGPKSRMVQVQLLRGSFDARAYFEDEQVLPEFDVVKAACHVRGRKKMPRPERGTVLRYDEDPGSDG